MEELEKASGRPLCAIGTSRGNCSSSHAFCGYLHQQIHDVMIYPRQRAYSDAWQARILLAYCRE